MIRILSFLVRCLDVYNKRPELVDKVISSADPDQEFNDFYSAFENEVIELMKLECNKKFKELEDKIAEQDVLIERQVAEIDALNELLSE
jgi:hypothetical protein